MYQLPANEVFLIIGFCRKITLVSKNILADQGLLHRYWPF